MKRLPILLLLGAASGAALGAAAQTSPLAVPPRTTPAPA